MSVNTIVVDGDSIALDSVNLFTVMKLSKGEHTFSTNGVFPDVINITGDWVITSGDIGYFNYPVEYKAEDVNSRKDNFSINISITGPVVVSDSIVVYLNKEFDSQDALKARLQSMLKKDEEGNYVSKRLVANFPNSLRELTQKDNFIKKQWDYTPDNVPEEITLYDTNSSTKRMMVPGNLLRVYTIFDEDVTAAVIQDEETKQVIEEYLELKKSLSKK